MKKVEDSHEEGWNCPWKWLKMVTKKDENGLEEDWRCSFKVEDIREKG